MALVVEQLDELVVSIPVATPEQCEALAAAMRRYDCDTVGGLCAVLVLRAMNVERNRQALRDVRRAV